VNAVVLTLDEVMGVSPYSAATLLAAFSGFQAVPVHTNAEPYEPAGTCTPYIEKFAVPVLLIVMIFPAVVTVSVGFRKC
jgi:hypothetical protein